MLGVVLCSTAAAMKMLLECVVLPNFSFRLNRLTARRDVHALYYN